MGNPRVIIAAPRSGSGKTMITCAMLKALSARGLIAAAFKCGPDYIDPMFHKEILGIPSKNLDLFFSDEEVAKALFLEENYSDISVIEGVMGLFDGLGGILEEASTYQLAKVLKAPILLVIDAHGMGRSVLAEISGFLSMDTEHLISGIILNRVSEMFYQSIKQLIEEEVHIPVYGYFPIKENLRLESRYLGLKLPGEIADLKQRVQMAAEELEKTVDLNRVMELAGKAGNLICLKPKWMLKYREKRVRIGVAYDKAFCFYYEDNLRLLKAVGAELIYFSPLEDKILPENLDGLLLGGGYPELFAKELSENENMRKSILYAVKSGMPSVAECGGFLYLHEAIVVQGGERYEMAGVLPGECRYEGKLVRFGYVDIREKIPCFLAKGENQQIKGHEFHYFDCDENGNDCIAVKPVTGRRWDCIRADSHSWWGFPHLYYPSNPDFVQSFIEYCERFKAEREIVSL